MKLRIKLLPIVAATSLVASITPMLTSCNKQGVVVSKISEYAAMYGNDVATTVYFTVSTDIADGQVLLLEAESSTLDITAARNENNSRIIDVTATRKFTEATDDIDEKIDLKFTCKDSSNNTLWTYTVKEYEFYYTPGATIPAEEKVTTCSYYNGVSYCIYNIDLKELPENSEVTAELINIAGLTTGSLESSFNVTNASGTLVVYYNDGKLGETATFDVRLTCRDKTTHKQLISPLTLVGFKLTYNNGVNALKEECFVWNADQTQIIGLDLTQDSEYATRTTLTLPAKAKSGAATYTIAANAFYNTSNEAGSKIPSNIERLKIDDEACTNIGANAFKDAPFTCIDLTQKSSDSAFTNVTFGTDSFKFKSVTDLTEGTILWKNDSSKEYWTFKHEVKQKLWFDAGLTNPQWFEYTAVSTEAELRAAAWHGGNIYLTNDIELNNILSFENTTGILDLCGFKISSKAGKALYNESTGELGLIRIYNSSFIIMDSGKDTGTGVVFTGTVQPSTDRTADGKALAAIQVTTTAGASANCGLKIIGGRYFGNDCVVYNDGGYVAIQSAKYGGNEYISEFHLRENALYPASYNASNMLTYKGEYATGETGLDHYYITSGRYMVTSMGSTKGFYPIRGRKQSDPTVQQGNVESWVPTGYYQKYTAASPSYYYITNQQ